MTHWNYRVMKTVHPDGETEFGFHEVHYEGGNVTKWTDKPVAVIGDTAEGMKDLASRLAEAAEKPALDATTGKEST